MSMLFTVGLLIPLPKINLRQLTLPFPRRGALYRTVKMKNLSSSIAQVAIPKSEQWENPRTLVKESRVLTQPFRLCKTGNGIMIGKTT